MVNDVWGVFSVENFVSYAEAAAEMSTSLRVLFEEYDSIVIPSRGAFPIFNAASSLPYYEKVMKKTTDEKRELAKEFLRSPINYPLVLPFSADPVTDQTSFAIRRFWSKVLSALVRRDVESPYLQFYKFLVEKVAKESFVSALPVRLPSNKFIFIDTVVSGRAISEIIESLEEEGLNECFFILIADNFGESIRGEYKRVIDRVKAEGRCEMIGVKDLFTEDRGPGVSGVWSTVYPGVMRKLSEKYDWAVDCYGAGTFYYKVSSSQVGESQGIDDPEYNMPNTLLYAILSVVSGMAVRTALKCDEIRKGNLPEDVELSDEKRDEMVEDIERKNACDMRNYLEVFLGNVKKFDSFYPLEKDTTKKLAQPRVRELWGEECEVSASSSHLVRVELPEDVIDELFVSFENYYLGLDPLSECDF